MFQVHYDIGMEFSTWYEWISNRIIRVACETIGIKWKSRGIHIPNFGKCDNMTNQHNRSIIDVVLHTLPSETIWEKATSSANFSCLLRYCVTPGSSFLSYPMSDFHCFPSASITSGSPISDMGGNSSNSFRILSYSSLNVITLFHWKWFLRVFCWCVYLISYAQGIVACQWLAWLSSMFNI